MLRLILASRNPHKTREFAGILGTDYEVTDISSAPYAPVVEETGLTFAENANLKAIAVSRVIPGLVVADDSGLEVEALGGAPGVYSARYAGEQATDQENVIKLLKELKRKDPVSATRCARFHCALALALNGEVISVFHGELNGDIAASPRGTLGFGYDPVFIPTGQTETFAELGDEVKNRMSHRAMAIRELRRHLAKQVRA